MSLIRRNSGIWPASLIGFLVIGAGCYGAGPTSLSATLSGAAEAPDPGDPDGSGTATITVDEGKSEVCWEIMVQGIEPTTASHIHRALAGVAGPVVVSLSAPSSGSSSGCTGVNQELAMELINTPAEFYVNVHNEDFPGGAVRGQLSK